MELEHMSLPSIFTFVYKYVCLAFTTSTSDKSQVTSGYAYRQPTRQLCNFVIAGFLYISHNQFTSCQYMHPWLP